MSGTHPATGYRFDAPCLPGPRAEHDHLAGLLPPGMLARRETAPDGAGDPAGCAVLAWARSGLMHLTGQPCGPPLAPRAPVLARVAAIAAAIAELTGREGRPVRLDPDHVLAFRASLHGWRRGGGVSANGTCRLLRAADGWVAVNLARPDDVRSVPAVLGRDLPAAGSPPPASPAPGSPPPAGPATAGPATTGPATAARPPDAPPPDSPPGGGAGSDVPAADGTVWSALRAEAAARPAAALAAAAQAVGIPAAALPGQVRPAAGLPPPVTATRLGQAGTAPRLVLDLSAMWAGPLCASILSRAGWRVLKVEDARRPDGARSGPAAFYADLHAGGRTAVLDLGSAHGRAELSRLAGLAGIVVESSRPRAVRRLGLAAEDWLCAAPGRLWVSVTGYGRQDPWQRVAFGDDAAVAGGLVAWTADGFPVFCGDAIADPLTGMFAALSALAAHGAGGGWLIDVPMAGVCADLSRPAAGPARPHLVSADGGAGPGAGWIARHGDLAERVRSW